ncbi:MAG TPA: phosphate ABC transporter permease subunit PstC [bacterium]|nr:phosphate ABC transporter permease subunit PstC [bacterium]
MQKRRLISRIKEQAIEKFFLLNGLFAILVLAGIFLLLLAQAWPAVKELGLKAFAASRWEPTSPVRESHGILALLVGTMMVSVGAMLLAVPLGIATAAWLADVAHARVREVVKPVIELLAAIPSVVVGFLGLVVLSPFLARLFNTSSGLNAVNGSILLAVMALPTIISISEDAITAVPQELKSASLALGANKWQTLIRVTVPSALSGIIAAVMLGMGRAIGETMTVLMVCGNAAAMPHSYLDPVRTMTATIAIELGETVQGSTHYHSLFVIAAVLFIITFLFNLISDVVLQRYQKVMR